MTEKDNIDLEFWEEAQRSEDDLIEEDIKITIEDDEAWEKFKQENMQHSESHDIEKFFAPSLIKCHERNWLLSSDVYQTRDQNYSYAYKLKNKQFIHPDINHNWPENSRINVACIYYPTKDPKHQQNDFSIDIIRNKQSDTNAAERLSCLMYFNAKNKFPAILDADYITPVPNHSSDIFESRGVSLAHKLFEIISKKEDKKTEYLDILEKRMKTDLKQMGGNLRRQFFANNLVYEVKSGLQINNCSILLIDDVVTSGSTSLQCVKQLLFAGARNVYVYCAGSTRFYGNF